MPTAPYSVKLEIFEGPLDLLLYLIRREELNIYDIPIARITQQYLAYLEFMKTLDLEIAGEFLVMAATLLKIKSKMLLPRHPEIEGEEAVDPRHDLVQQLLEYRKFKEAAGRLEEKETHQRLMFPRPKGAYEKPDPATIEPRRPEVGLFDLLAAFRQVADRLDKVDIYNIVGEDITIEDRIDFVQNRIREHGKLNFFGLFEHETRRIVVVMTFFALLELIRLGRVVVRQRGLFGEIWLYAPNRTDIEPELKVDYTPPEPKRRTFAPAETSISIDSQQDGVTDEPAVEAETSAVPDAQQPVPDDDPATGNAKASESVASEAPRPAQPIPENKPSAVMPESARDETVFENTRQASSERK
ncbi:MAG: segregation/condensation protein A [Candidatus Edwardsbacteria bacterium]|nr:segregation/condensation protein A [Candidatus Edwardsbacteria bacterium]